VTPQEPAPLDVLRKKPMIDTSDVQVFVGLDVGKSEHHAHGLTPAG
jgi:hypothetical protein